MGAFDTYIEHDHEPEYALKRVDGEEREGLTQDHGGSLERCSHLIKSVSSSKSRADPFWFTDPLALADFTSSTAAFGTMRDCTRGKKCEIRLNNNAKYTIFFILQHCNTYPNHSGRARAPADDSRRGHASLSEGNTLHF